MVFSVVFLQMLLQIFQYILYDNELFQDIHDLK